MRRTSVPVTLRFGAVLLEKCGVDHFAAQQLKISGRPRDHLPQSLQSRGEKVLRDCKPRRSQIPKNLTGALCTPHFLRYRRVSAGGASKISPCTRHDCGSNACRCVAREANPPSGDASWSVIKNDSKTNRTISTTIRSELMNYRANDCRSQGFALHAHQVSKNSGLIPKQQQPSSSRFTQPRLGETKTFFQISSTYTCQPGLRFWT